MGAGRQGWLGLVADGLERARRRIDLWLETALNGAAQPADVDSTTGPVGTGSQSLPPPQVVPTSPDRPGSAPANVGGAAHVAPATVAVPSPPKPPVRRRGKVPDSVTDLMAVLGGAPDNYPVTDAAFNALAYDRGNIAILRAELHRKGWQTAEQTWVLGTQGSRELYVSSCTLSRASGAGVQTALAHARWAKADAVNIAFLDAVAAAIGRPLTSAGDDVRLEILHHGSFIRGKQLADPPSDLKQLLFGGPLFARPALAMAELLVQCTAVSPSRFARELMEEFASRIGAGSVEASALAKVLQLTLAREAWRGSTRQLLQTIALAPGGVPAVIDRLAASLGWEVAKPVIVEVGRDPDGSLFVAASEIRRSEATFRTRRARVARTPDAAAAATLLDLLCDFAGVDAPRLIAGEVGKALAAEGFVPDRRLGAVVDPTLARLLVEDRRLFLSALRLVVRYQRPPPLTRHVIEHLVTLIRKSEVRPEMLAELFVRLSPFGIDAWMPMLAPVVEALRSVPGAGVHIPATPKEVELDRQNLEHSRNRMSIVYYFMRLAFNRAAAFDLVRDSERGAGGFVEALVEVVTSDEFLEGRRGGAVDSDCATYFAARALPIPPKGVMSEDQRYWDMVLGSALRTELAAACQAASIPPERRGSYLALLISILERTQVHRYIRDDMTRLCSVTEIMPQRDPLSYWTRRLFHPLGEVTFRWKDSHITLETPSVVQALGRKVQLDGEIAAKGQSLVGAAGPRGIDGMVSAVFLNQRDETVSEDRYAILYHVVTGQMPALRDCFRLLAWLRPESLSDITRENWLLTPADITQLRKRYPQAGSEQSLAAIMGVPGVEALTQPSRGAWRKGTKAGPDQQLH